MKKSNLIASVLVTVAVVLGAGVIAPKADAKVHTETKTQYHFEETHPTKYFDINYNAAFAKMGNRMVPHFKWVDTNHGLEHSSDGTIYYYEDPSLTALEKDTYAQAIANWNALGVVKLTPTNDKSQARIGMMSDSSPVSAYLCEMDGEYAPRELVHDFGLQQNGYLIDSSNTVHNVADVTLNSTAITGSKTNTSQNHRFAVNVAIHEIGHALGLAHDKSTAPVYSKRTTWVFDDHTGKLVKKTTNHFHYANAVAIMAPGDLDTGNYNKITPLGAAEKAFLLKFY